MKDEKNLADLWEGLLPWLHEGSCPGCARTSALLPHSMCGHARAIQNHAQKKTGKLIKFNKKNYLLSYALINSSLGIPACVQMVLKVEAFILESLQNGRFNIKIFVSKAFDMETNRGLYIR